MFCLSVLKKKRIFARQYRFDSMKMLHHDGCESVTCELQPLEYKHTVILTDDGQSMQCL